jgi:predicted dehydrogenase
MSDRLRLIQCGVGGFGNSWLRQFVANSPDFQIAAIVDVNPDALHVGDSVGVPAERRFTSLEMALERVEADAVLTVTPPTVHLEHARLAFARGLHLMTDKPIADTIANAKEMTDLADASGRQLVVSQNYRYRPQPMKLRQMLADRALGELGHGHIDFYIPADFTGSFRETMPHVLLVDMAIHHVDLLRHITGRNVVDVFATTFRPPWSWYGHNPGLKMMLRLQGDVWFTYTGDWSARGRNTGWSGDWRLQCADGSIHWSFDSVSVARSSRGFVEDTKVEPVDCTPLDPADRAATLAGFARAIRTGKSASTSGRDNLWSFGAIMAAVKSTETRRPVNVTRFIRQPAGR